MLCETAVLTFVVLARFRDEKIHSVKLQMVGFRCNINHAMLRCKKYGPAHSTSII